MLFSTSILAATFASLVLAQTPSGFKPQTTNKLEVIFKSTMVNKAGQQLDKASVATQPQLALSSAMVSKTDTYMFVMLDLDVPPAGGSKDRRVLLHCMNTGFKATKQELGGAATLLASSEKGPASYISPSPPATDTVAHRYVELLFQQPSNLSIPESTFANMQARINFDLEAFMAKNDVKNPVAANFFLVDGKANATKAKATGTGAGSMPSSTVEPFRGSAGKASMPFGTVAQLGWLALFALFVL